MYLSLFPIEITHGMRHPRYLKVRDVPGLRVPYTMMDFGGGSLVGLVATEVSVEQTDIFPLAEWTTSRRASLVSFLRDGGIEDVGWLTGAPDIREACHRLGGLAQAMQSAADDIHTTPAKQDPSKWLARKLHFGRESLGALDVQGFLSEQYELQWIFTDPDGDRWKIEGLYWVSESGKSIKIVKGRALPATESFTGTNGDQISTLTNWARQNAGTLIGDIDIQSNAFAPDAAATASYYWTGDAFGNDQYSEFTVAAISTGLFLGASMRNTSGGNCYIVNADSADAGYTEKFVSGSWTSLSSAGSTLSVSDVYRGEAEGTTIRSKINGSADMSVTDSSLSTGAAGIATYGDGTTSRGDDWEGGDLGGGAGRTTKNKNSHPLGYAYGVGRKVVS